MISNFVLGATGAVGEFLLPLLVARGERVVALSRTAHIDAVSGAVEWLRGDLFGAMPPLLAVDTIYSLGPLDVFSTWFAAQLVAGASPPRALVALSSMSAESKQASIDAAERALAERLCAAEVHACLLILMYRHECRGKVDLKG